jgi:hypothetical protein
LRLFPFCDFVAMKATSSVLSIYFLKGSKREGLRYSNSSN